MVTSVNQNRGTFQVRTLGRRINVLVNRLTGRNGVLARLTVLETNGTVSSVSAANSTSDGSANIRTQVIELNHRLISLETKVAAIESSLSADNCRSMPCLNGGTCVNGYERFVCQCLPNWTGDTCAEDINECAQFAGTELGCQNGATCVNEQGGYRYVV